MEQLSLEGRRRVYRAVCYLAHADGQLEQSERSMLDQLREIMELESADASVLENESKTGQNLTLKGHPLEAKAALHYLAELMVADGVLHPNEVARIKRITSALGFKDRELESTLKQAMVRRGRKLSR